MTNDGSHDPAQISRIEWLPRSERDLVSIRIYIGEFAPLAAQRFTARLLAAVESLTTQPNRGRPAGRYAREFVAISPYLIRYRVFKDVVQIIRIRHGAQWPDQAVRSAQSVSRAAG